MANAIKIRRSSVPGKIPTSSDILLGELAVNFNDGKLFLKKSTTGSESGAGVAIVEVGGKSAIAQTKIVIDNDITLDTGYNGVSVGSVEIAATYTVTVPANATWMVVI